MDYLKELGIPVLRWPGGCFADDYHWRDGIGPAAKRPKDVNIHWGMYTEDNSFGTHEFIELCRLIGAEPYLAGNVGSGTPQELRDWVEYCNYPTGSSLSDERAANGSPEPFKVRYWGVGNENWGCGGEHDAPGVLRPLPPLLDLHPPVRRHDGHSWWRAAPIGTTWTGRADFSRTSTAGCLMDSRCTSIPTAATPHPIHRRAMEEQLSSFRPLGAGHPRATGDHR